LEDLFHSRALKLVLHIFHKSKSCALILPDSRVLISGEHTRPRVWQSAPTPTASAHTIGSKEDAKTWSAGAPTTTREARVLPGPMPPHRTASF
jgi:hypothetical protein